MECSISDNDCYLQKEVMSSNGSVLHPGMGGRCDRYTVVRQMVYGEDGQG